MTQEEIDAKLLGAVDEEYKAFNARIVNSKLPMLGVRAPFLKSLAKEIAKEPGDFFESYRAENYEQILLYSLTLAVSKMSYEEKLPYLDKILPKYDNWAHIDMTVGAFKQLGKNREEFLRKYSYLVSAPEFERRFMVIFLMDYCLTENMLDTVFDMYKAMQCDMYYVNMGIAWGISVALVKFYDRTLALLKEKPFNDFIMRKSVQKARESFRISEERKEELKKL